MNIENLIKIGIEFHGHKCPAMPLGIKVGLCALEKLNVKRAKNKELYCICESGPSHATMCFVDGVQIATGCTYGKGNIEKVNYSKNAITLIDLKTGNSIRVSIKPEFQIQGLTSQFVNLRKNGVEPQDIDEKIVEPMIKKVISSSYDEILKIEEVKKIDFTPPKGTFYWKTCKDCGEVVFSHGLRFFEDNIYCISCYNKIVK